MQDVVDLTIELCTIPSTTGSEAGVVDDLATRLTRLGAKVTRQNVGGVVGRDNLLAVSDPSRPIDLLLTTHIDTVPPFIPPTIVGDELHGRGVIDAKGIAASMILAWQRLLARKDGAGENVGLLFVVGEETNSDGAKLAAVSGFAPAVRFFINGEPTDGLLCRAMKGVLAFQLDVEGKAAHSAYPAAGHSATHQLITDLHKLTSAQWPVTEYGPTTLNVGVMDGGVAQNVIAPHASAKIMMRPTDDPDRILETVRSLLSTSTKLQVLTKAPPVKLHVVGDEETCVVAFGSDVPHLAPLLEARHGSPLLFGPGSILDAHTSHERVSIKDLHNAVDAYERMALRLLEKA
ncbi:MAG: M20/M25/M40 family metallo-hydrolase [Deltaproteobacteria bacterium]|nr:M20/M25/M40 family metallo-hydrolase [Deltaproteobacteria bacterium]